MYEIARRGGVTPGPNTIGRIRHIGNGLSNVVFGATLQLHEECEVALVIKLPAPSAGPNRNSCLRTEAAVLRHLNAQRLPFAIPRPVDEIETAAGLATVQEWVDGFVVDLRAPRFPGGKPWEFVAEVAAGIHAVDAEPIRSQVPSHGSRLDHAVFCLRRLESLDEPEARDSGMWIREHLPPNTSASLLHGDLLGQNLRRPWDDSGRPGVIDWAEACIGDPAYDLAIVTRGHRKPFGVTGGLERLVDAYNRVAAAPLTVAHVRVHEIILHAMLYGAVARDYGLGSPHAEQQRSAWRSLLRRKVHALEGS